MRKFSHLDSMGKARMVDVTEKPSTNREALARATVKTKREVLADIIGGKIPKGDVMAVARIAGIMAAKNTATIIPLCHPLNISSADLTFEPDKKTGEITITSRVRTSGQTGVEMEALVAVSAAALAIYDMCKSADRSMSISDICLIEKRGGKSGTYRRGSRK